MEFREQLVNLLNNRDRNAVLFELGYFHPTKKQIDRFEKVISSPKLGLESSDFDFKYSNAKYILKLTEICDLNTNDAEEYIQYSKNKLRDLHNSFKPYLFVETGFRRTTQPIFLLAAVESFRYVKLPIDFIELQPLDQLNYLHDLIDEHMSKTQGSLQIWGNILSYFYVYDKGCALEITPTGKIVKNHFDFEPSTKARLEHNGKAFKFA